MAVFNGNVFYSAVYFTDGTAPDAIKTGTGGIDPGEGLKRRRIVKPSGYLPRGGRKNVAERLDESRNIQAEIAGQLAREFGEETQRAERETERLAVERMTQEEIAFEIGILLRKRVRLQTEDELLLLLMMAASA